jgi:HAD superfamily hydrolase (TIGR01458 family)
MSAEHKIVGVLCDLSGVLHVGEKAIEGSVEAARRLLSLPGVSVRFVTNTDYVCQRTYLGQLQRMGFSELINSANLFTAPRAARSLVGRMNLRPFLVMNDDARHDFDDSVCAEPYNAVVLADVDDRTTTMATMNEAFRVLMRSADNVLIAMGGSRYYRREDGLRLDCGSTKAMLEFGAERRAIVAGKPSPEFFNAALDDLKLDAADCVMIGDDVVTDVGGAQALGMRGLLVRTGKYSEADERRDDVEPHRVVDDLRAAVEWIESTNAK